MDLRIDQTDATDVGARNTSPAKAVLPCEEADSRLGRTSAKMMREWQFLAPFPHLAQDPASQMAFNITPAERLLVRASNVFQRYAMNHSQREPREWIRFKKGVISCLLYSTTRRIIPYEYRQSAGGGAVAGDMFRFYCLRPCLTSIAKSLTPGVYDTFSPSQETWECSTHHRDDLRSEKAI